MEFGFLFVHAMTVIGTIAGVFNPMVGLMVYYSFSVLRPTSLWYWNAWPTERYSFYVAIGTLIGWTVRQFGSWTNARHVKWPLIGLGLYLLGGAIATMFANRPDWAWQFLELQLKIGLMALLTVSLVINGKQIQAFAWVLLLSLGYLAYNLNVHYHQYPGYVWRLQTLGFGGVDNNGVAMIMVTGVPVAFFMATQPTRWPWLVKPACVLIALMLIHVVLFSFSRGGQLGLAIMGVMLVGFALWKLPHKMAVVGLGAVVVMATLWLAGPQVRTEFRSIFVDAEERDASASSRFDTWSAGVQSITERPLGWGPRQFNFVSQRYGLAPNKSIHNLFLQTGADYGVLGLAGLALFYFGSMWKAYQVAHNPTAIRMGWPASFGWMVTLSLSGFLVCSIFIGMESVEIGYMIALLGLCTAGYVEQISAYEHETEEGILPELAQVPEPEEVERYLPAPA